MMCAMSSSNDQPLNKQELRALMREQQLYLEHLELSREVKERNKRIGEHIERLRKARW